MVACVLATGPQQPGAQPAAAYGYGQYGQPAAQPQADADAEEVVDAEVVDDKEG